MIPNEIHMSKKCPYVPLQQVLNIQGNIRFFWPNNYKLSINISFINVIWIINHGHTTIIYSRMIVLNESWIYNELLICHAYGSNTYFMHYLHITQVHTRLCHTAIKIRLLIFLCIKNRWKTYVLIQPRKLDNHCNI